MYLKRIYLENVGPIEKIEIELPFYGEGEKSNQPKPLILVGKNGSGKSSILSFAVNTFFEMKRAAYDKQDEIDGDSTFRIRKPDQIKRGKNHYYSKIDIEGENSVVEFRTILPEDKLDPAVKAKKKEAGDDGFNHSFIGKKDIYKNKIFLYFPPNRFEEPVWFNKGALNSEAKFEQPEFMSNKTKRKIIQQSPLKEVKNWLLDLLLDEFNYESEHNHVTFPDGTTKIGVFPKEDGVGVNIRNSLNKFLRDFLQRDKVRIGFGNRRTRSVQIIEPETEDEDIKMKTFMPDLFAMSSGETSLFCMFCAILRDADLANLFSETDEDGKWKKLEDIEGIVVVDEIDLHLHTKMQSETLPKLIALFPRIQFIITTHSPLFLLGMEVEFGKNVKIIEIANGEDKDINSAHTWEESVVQRKLLKEKISENFLIRNKLPEIESIKERLIILVEGKTDKMYIDKALAYKKELDEFYLEDVAVEMVGNGEDIGGIPALKKFADVYKGDRVLQGKTIVLLYDCDAENLPTGDEGLVVKKLQKIKNSPIEKGIENLFAEDLILDKSREPYKSIEILIKVKKSGVSKESEKQIRILPDKRKNQLCNWICNNGTDKDFENFNQIFQMMEKLNDEVLGTKIASE